jgi:hypothetical protein
MADRSEELRSKAARCLALAQTTADPEARAKLVLMAQSLFDLANRPGIDFDARVQGFNDQQMTNDSVPKPVQKQPVVQQQQQPQPKHDED